MYTPADPGMLNPVTLRRVLRYIEVKGRGPKDAGEVSLTDPEWKPLAV
jgi:hypothetical protein